MTTGHDQDSILNSYRIRKGIKYGPNTLNNDRTCKKEEKAMRSSWKRGEFGILFNSALFHSPKCFDLDI